MALYIPHSIFHLARLLYVRPETFGPYYVRPYVFIDITMCYIKPSSSCDGLASTVSVCVLLNFKYLCSYTLTNTFESVGQFSVKKKL